MQKNEYEQNKQKRQIDGAHNFNLSTQDAETVDHCKFIPAWSTYTALQASQGYTL